MRRTITLFAALALLAAGPAMAQKIDANGRCHDASGKFAKAEVCGGASASTPKASKPAKSTAAAPAAAATTTTTKAETKAEKSADKASKSTTKSASAATKPAKCKDAKGKYTKCPA